MQVSTKRRLDVNDHVLVGDGNVQGLEAVVVNQKRAKGDALPRYRVRLVDGGSKEWVSWYRDAICRH